MECKLNHVSDVTELLEYSHSMLMHAEAGEWDTVVSEDIIRRQMINAYFSEPSNIANEPDISTAIQQLLLINDRMEKLAFEAREMAKAEVKSISNGRKAVNAYVDNAR